MQVIAIELCLNLVASIERLSTKSSISELRQASIGIAGSISNVVTSFNDALKPSTIESDDATNTTAATRESSEESIPENVQKSDLKRKLASTFKKANAMLAKLSALMSTRLAYGEKISVKTDQVTMNVKKATADELDPVISAGSARFGMPNFCGVQKKKINSTNKQDQCGQQTVVSQVIYNY